MHAFSANSRETSSDARQIVFLIYPGIALLDLAGPLQVFLWARTQGSGKFGYHAKIVSEFGGEVPSDSLLKVDTEPLKSLSGFHIDTLIVVGGDGVYEAANSDGLVAGIADLASRSRRICSICSGAYLLAKAGFLQNRKAVTHWSDAEKLKDDFPDILLETDPIYIKDSDIWTSAGVTAGIDMSLAIVTEDLGRKAALERAQALVTYMVRPGGQSQFSSALKLQRLDRTEQFDALHQWISENLKADLCIENLASHQNMSTRNFHRVYQDTMNMTPAKAVASIRLERARNMLETTSNSIKLIAYDCGFRNEEQMRRTFFRNLGITPNEYRDRFRIIDT